jgi:hypothetical protein
LTASAKTRSERLAKTTVEPGAIKLVDRVKSLAVRQINRFAVALTSLVTLGVWPLEKSAVAVV